MNQFLKIFSDIGKKITNLERKKVLEIAGTIMLFGVILILAGGYFDKEPVAEDDSKTENGSQSSNSSDDLEERMETVLSNIKGAGKVRVMVTYTATKERVPVFETSTNEAQSDENNSDESANRGSRQKDVQNKVAYEEYADGVRRPIIQKEIEPQIKGVVVVAAGAGTEKVRDNIAQAVMVLLDLPIYKIQIFE